MRYTIPLVNRSGLTIGYGDRWATHRTKKDPDGLILGQKHVGITIACLDENAKILVQHRRHKIFDKVWSLSGDTHPRKYEGKKVETLSQASRRCAEEDLGLVVNRWAETLNVSYSAQDPRDPKYCENELLYILVGRYSGQPHANKKNVYALRSVELSEISKRARADMKRRPIDRMYAPWVHAVFSLPRKRIEKALQIR